MTHLRPAQIVDAVEGHASPETTRHLEACARCRDEVQAAAGVLNVVKTVPPPDVSPLYWDHLASNIRERAGERPRVRRSLAWIWAPAGGIAGAVALAIGITNMHGTSPALRPAAMRPPLEHAAIVPVDDSSWNVMSEISDDLAWDEVDAAGLAVRPGAADRAAANLPPDEREELARLLREEMARLKP